MVRYLRHIRETEVFSNDNNLRKAGVYPEELDKRKIQSIEVWAKSKSLVRRELHEVGGWRWASDNAEVVWEMGTKDWLVRLATRKHFTDYLNDKWDRSDTRQEWQKRWIGVWNAAIHQRKKVWTWRFLQKGYFTGSRGKGWSDERKRCPRCNEGEETFLHTFWTCRRVRRRIQELRSRGIIPEGTGSLIQWLDLAIQHSKEDSSYLWAFRLYITTTWTDRNNAKFRGQRSHRPIDLFLQQLNLEIEAFPHPNTSERQFEITWKAKTRVQGWISTAARERYRQEHNEEIGSLSGPASHHDHPTIAEVENNADTDGSEGDTEDSATESGPT
ncbi:hypothetical protein R1sor_002297 [Riccia sorocarpa]|uniref:Reverse transcriptase zinc-binding domain-containing protein n=1 Tax=Riccia sorocarpa TaxID=122646 RepID=A0ABD3H1H6_9MARC